MHKKYPWRTHDHHIPEKTGGHGIFQTIRGDREDLRAWTFFESAALKMIRSALFVRWNCDFELKSPKMSNKTPTRELPHRFSNHAARTPACGAASSAANNGCARSSAQLDLTLPNDSHLSDRNFMLLL
jgi:hypothetical protein